MASSSRLRAALRKDVCDRISCKAFTDRKKNHCSALTEVYPEDCPFYKTEKEYEEQIERLLDGGHEVDLGGQYGSK